MSQLSSIPLQISLALGDIFVFSSSQSPETETNHQENTVMSLFSSPKPSISISAASFVVWGYIIIIAIVIYATDLCCIWMNRFSSLQSSEAEKQEEQAMVGTTKSHLRHCLHTTLAAWELLRRLFINSTIAVVIYLVVFGSIRIDTRILIVAVTRQ